MSAKTKQRIRGWLIFILIIIIVVLFVALVVGLSLGLKDDDNCPSGQKHCSGNCRNLKTDPNHCGKCNNKCALGLDCVDGHCEYCGTNCTNNPSQDNVCLLPPSSTCNNTDGCPLDCDTDDDMCSVGTCNPTTGCQARNCTTDDNVCTIPPCNPETGCTLLDCNGDDDPCTTEPCNPILGCAFVCTTLTLNPPSVDFTATYADFSIPRRIVGTGLTIGSLTNIQSVAITIAPSGSGGNFNYTTSGGITDTGLSGDTFTLTGNATPSVWQTVLRTLTYENDGFSGSTATFTFSVTNLSITSPHTPVSTINV